MILLIVNNKQYAQLESIEDRYKLMSDKRAHVYIFDEYSEVVINFFIHIGNNCNIRTSAPGATLVTVSVHIWKQHSRRG